MDNKVFLIIMRARSRCCYDGVSSMGKLLMFFEPQFFFGVQRTLFFSFEYQGLVQYCVVCIV